MADERADARSDNAGSEDRADPPIARPDPAADGRDVGPVARPFTEDVFDEEYYSRRGGKPRGGSPIGLALGVVLGAAVAGGGAWYVFRQPTTGGAAPDIVKAETTPYKVKPESPGGMQVDNTGVLVYERVSKGEAPRPVENLLPAPEQPKTPPKAPEPISAESEKTPAEKQARSDSDVQGIVDQMIKTMEAQQAASKASMPAGSELPEVVPSMAGQPAPEAAPAARPAVADAIPPSPPPVAVPAATAVQNQAAPAPPAVSDAAPPPVQTAALPAGTFAVQLAAARSEQQAMGEWTRVYGKHGAAMAGLTPNVVRADLGERGIYYRLRAGPLPDKAAADALCETLKAANEACIVVRP
jgi:hypothetical protein